MELELLELMIFNRSILCSDENGEVDETYVIQQTLLRRRDEIERNVYLRMRMEESRVNKLLGVRLVLLL
ncbi:hypothetical protein DPMN_099549 [Dreissena polymorpha]|uniref:Uncharacterized protein n=1 Tax=Dreissena polymorpha TaxID=45954 RepID=A0A9D4LFT8_DREPO|nr:hypothetical protein DPMN_099549 [Dreissena polymorpha]